MKSGGTSLLSSLERLGIRLSVGQLIGVGAAIVAGLVVARILPYTYPIISARLLDFLFGRGVSSLRDSFNTTLMTVCTCSISFLVAFITTAASRLFRRIRDE